MSRILNLLIRFNELYKYRYLLKNGIYYINRNFKCLCRKDVKDFALFRLCAKGPFFSIWYNRRKVDNNYSIVLLSNTTKGNKSPVSIKLFDIENGLVRTQYNSYDKIRIDLNNQLSKLLLTPKILQINNEEMYIVEEYITSKRIDEILSTDRLEIINIVIDNCISYYRKYINYNDSLCLSLDSEDSDLLLKSYSKLPLELKEIQKYEVLQHGDLTLSNLLYNDKKQLYYIDFEHEGYYFFLYDIFWLIQNDLVYNNNSFLIDLYFSGGLDNKMLNLFNVVGLDFLQAERKSYFIMFLASMYNCRIKNLDAHNLEIGTNSINYVLKYIDNFVK